MTTDSLDFQYWESRWQTGQTGWDLRDASPPLCAYCLQIPAGRRDLDVLIPGCGNGHEALFLLRQGFSRLTLLDIAPTAVEALQKRLDDEAPAGWRQRLRLVCGDFFAHAGRYDLILEQTFFCALDPALRAQYALKMKELLYPGGRLAGVLFDREFEGGPPFGGSRAEYEALFGRYFKVVTLAPCYNSAEPRRGTEVFAILENAAPA